MSAAVFPSAGQQGRSLIELMIVLAIGVSISLGMVMLFSGSQGTVRTQHGAAYVADTGRYALQVLSRQLRLAGYQRQVFYDSTWMQQPDDAFQSLFGCTGGFDDPSAATPACTGTVGSPDAFVVRYGVDVQENAGGPSARTVAYDPVRSRGVDCLGNRVPEPADPANDPFVVENRYFMRYNSVTRRNELVCRGGATGEIMPVAEGVDDLVLRYSVDRVDTASGGRDMSVDTFTRANGVNDNEWLWNDVAGATSDTRSRRVLAVEICLVIRSMEKQPVGGQRYLDCRAGEITSTDGFYRQVFRTVVVMRNHVSAP